jgi:tRNA (guanine37-N1)-methyltransferase
VKFSILTLFPQLLAPFAQEAILGKAVQRGLLEIDIFDIRKVTSDKHRTVDDTPYGGGAGMVMRVDVVAKALEQVNAEEIILLTPAGEPFTQKTAEALAQKKHIALLCGRYEGFDARLESLVTRQISLGEAAAACILEAVARLLPNVLGDAESHQQDSFSSGILDYPEYTRPLEFGGQAVPEVLRGGNHAAIARWRRQEALRRTLERRPDLLPTGLLASDAALLLELGVTEAQVVAWGLELPKKKRRK